MQLLIILLTFKINKSMNRKETLIWSIIDNVIVVCDIPRADGTHSITRESIVSKSREENVVMARALVVEQLVHAGFTITSIAYILNRTVQATKYLFKLSTEFYQTSRAFRLAASEATLMNKDVEPIFCLTKK